ncbi:MAG: hypothetical protein ACT4N5_08620 [Nitrosopumilaceae archaeon]
MPTSIGTMFSPASSSDGHEPYAFAIPKANSTMHPASDTFVA